MAELTEAPMDCWNCSTSCFPASDAASDSASRPPDSISPPAASMPSSCSRDARSVRDAASEEGEERVWRKSRDARCGEGERRDGRCGEGERERRSVRCGVRRN
eukprot:3595059-Rhodomonas_salina.1